tara:strand:+ start:1948 stop:2205 length:258 start_codon:yes stop_codon:yes gene_type:complete
MEHADVARPSRESLPAMFIRQPRSAASSVSAPVAAIWRVLSETMAVEISGYFTAKVPPKPQQAFSPSNGTSFRPSTCSSSLSGWA